MALGTGWEITESEQFWESYERNIAGSQRHEELIEGFVWGLHIDWTSGPVRRNVLANFWFVVLIGPPPFYIFFEIDEERQQITLEFVTPTP